MPKPIPKFKRGAPLYKPVKAFAPDNNPGLRGGGPDPIVIPGCHLVVFKKQTVGSPTDGMVLFVGRYLNMLYEKDIEAFRKKYSEQYDKHRLADIPVQFGDVKKLTVWSNCKSLPSSRILNPLNPFKFKTFS